MPTVASATVQCLSVPPPHSAVGGRRSVDIAACLPPACRPSSRVCWCDCLSVAGRPCLGRGGAGQRPGRFDADLPGAFVSGENWTRVQCRITGRRRGPGGGDGSRWRVKQCWWHVHGAMDGQLRQPGQLPQPGLPKGETSPLARLTEGKTYLAGTARTGFSIRD